MSTGEKRVNVAAVVLAAGASTRLGRSKALLEIDGEAALARVVRQLSEAGVRSGVVVIGGEHADAIRATVEAAPLRYEVNPHPAAGRLGSLVVGLAATDAAADVLLWPVDRPMADTSTVRALLASAEPGDSKPRVGKPVFDGRRGHPVWLAASLRERLLAAPADANLRELLADVASIDVPVDDPGIHVNLDTEADWRRMREDPPAE